MEPDQAGSEEQFEQLKEILLPIFADAAAGRFDKDVPLPVDGTHEFHQLLVGVQILLEEIRQQREELTGAQTMVADVQYRTSEILARVLDRTLPPGA